MSFTSSGIKLGDIATCTNCLKEHYIKVIILTNNQEWLFCSVECNNEYVNKIQSHH